jgi:hypothetical protein
MALDAVSRDDPKLARKLVAELTGFLAHKPETAAGRRALAGLETMSSMARTLCASPRPNSSHRSIYGLSR